MVYSSAIEVWGLGFGVQGSRFMVRVSGCWGIHLPPACHLDLRKHMARKKGPIMTHDELRE
jgi:hypothetical protein